MTLSLRPSGLSLPSQISSQMQGRFRGATLGMSLGMSLASSMQLTMPALEAILPGLLRYHDSWTRRQLWLSQLSLTDSPQPDLASSVEILLLGDVLEAVLSYPRIPSQMALLRDITRLQVRSVKYDLSSQDHRSYQSLLADLLQQLPLVEMMGRRCLDSGFLQGIVIALQHLESPALAVQVAAQVAVSQAATLDGVSVAIAGLLSGAISGHAGLPITWQIGGQRGQLADFAKKTQIKTPEKDDRTESHRVRCCEAVAIADALFAQWAGIQPSY